MINDSSKSFPKRIVLVCNDSVADLNENVCEKLPDDKISLSQIGVKQAVDISNKVCYLLHPEDKVVFYSSPYVRAKQTLAEILKNININHIDMIHEDPRLSEQNFGNFQDCIEKNTFVEDRRRFGDFYYRFVNGESALDVYNRMTCFIDSLHRRWASDSSNGNINSTVVILTHEIALRVFLMKWYRFSVTEFESICKSRQSCVITMYRRDEELLPFNKTCSLMRRTYHYYLDDSAYRVLDLPKSIRDNETKNRALDELARILMEAKEGCAILSQYSHGHSGDHTKNLEITAK